MRVYNPKGHHLDDGVAPKCVAQNAQELSWRWATSLDNSTGRGPHMIKSMWDIKDNYDSMMVNVRRCLSIYTKNFFLTKHYDRYTH